MYPVSIGVIKPVVPPKQLTIPYKVPAKFGAKSWEFWRLVRVEAPFIPKANVRKMTAKVGSHPDIVCETKNTPGMK